MISEKQLEANHHNALRSTGPKTADGVEAIKLNALRHGLRSVQTVVPGEDPAAWEAHQAAVIEDLKPAGTLEYALAEQIAAKLWRLGRVVLFEANVIGNAQDPEELAHSTRSPTSARLWWTGPDRHPDERGCPEGQGFRLKRDECGDGSTKPPSGNSKPWQQCPILTSSRIGRFSTR